MDIFSPLFFSDFFHLRTSRRMLFQNNLIDEITTNNAQIRTHCGKENLIKKTIKYIYN